MRKKAREVNAKSRRLEEELESEKDEKSTFEAELATLTTSMKKLQARVEVAEKDLDTSRSDLEKERKAFQSKIEEEKTKWKLESLANSSGPPTPSESNHFLRAENTFGVQNRKTSNPDLLGLHIPMHSHGRRSNAGSRTFSSDRDLPPLHTDSRPSSSRRTSNQPSAFHHPGMPNRTTTDSTTQSRHNFSPADKTWGNGSVPQSATISVAPSIDIDDMDRESTSSPHRTVNELISGSTAGAGPSVQLVERMSAAVRRLESEKASNKEELSRIQGQRDEARQEVVILMREVGGLKASSDKVTQLEEEIKEVKGKFEAALEMLGEKSEEAEELKNDVQDLKKLYRELVDSTLK
jgi:archaellum component FlaC